MTNTPDTDPPQHPETTVVSNAPPRPGFKTSEFWLKVAAFALTALFASGAIPTTGPVATVTAIAATMLGALGYTVSRTLVKNASAFLVLAVLGIALSSIACGATTGSTAKGIGIGGVAAAVECTAPDRAKLEAQFGPTVEAALQRAIGLDGKIDVPSLNQIGASLEADGWCVLEREAAKLIAWVATKVPSGAAAAAAPLDGPYLSARLAELRAAKFPGVVFKVGAVQ